MAVKVILREDAKRRLRAIFANLARRAGNFIVSRLRPSFWRMRSQLIGTLKGRVGTLSFKQQPLAPEGGVFRYENLPSSLQMRRQLWELSKYQGKVPFRKFLPLKEQLKEEFKDALVRKLATEQFPIEAEAAGNVLTRSTLFKRTPHIKPLDLEATVEEIADVLAKVASKSTTAGLTKLRKPIISRVRPYLMGGHGPAGQTLEAAAGKLRYDIWKTREAIKLGSVPEVVGRERWMHLDEELKATVEKLAGMAHLKHKGLFPRLEEQAGKITFDKKIRVALQKKYGRASRARRRELDRLLGIEVGKMYRM